jgi:hypothetical protein
VVCVVCGVMYIMCEGGLDLFLSATTIDDLFVFCT